MIWKIATGLLVGLLITGAFLYIPDLRFWNKQADQANQALADSLRIRTAERDQARRSDADNEQLISQAQRDLQLSNAQQAAVLPTIKLEVSGLSALAQRTANMESLIKSNLIKSSDTTSWIQFYDAPNVPSYSYKPISVTYSEKVNEALTVKLRLCDSLSATYLIRDQAAALTRESYQVRGDTLQKIKVWIDDGEKIAQKKGWFTGRNKELRQHAKAPPI